MPKNINKGGRKREEKRAALDDDPEFLGSFLQTSLQPPHKPPSSAVDRIGECEHLRNDDE